MASRATSVPSAASAAASPAPAAALTGGTRCIPQLDYLGRLARDRSEAALRPFGLRPRHLLALTRLADRAAVSQQELGVELRLDPSNLVGLLNELEVAGLISRQRAAADRRRHVVELTTRGAGVLHDVLQALRAVEQDVLRPLDQEQRALLADLLARVVGDGAPCSSPPHG
ncbi:MAG: MarR family winged helix-turn-helix transcriptional regulator, partial [Janthinobacterium lividum]